MSEGEGISRSESPPTSEKPSYVQPNSTGVAASPPPPGFTTHIAFDAARRQTTLGGCDLPPFPPAIEEFRLDAEMSEALPEHLENTVESNANKAEGFCWAMVDYQTHEEGQFSDHSMAGLVAAWTSLDAGLDRLKTALELHMRQADQEHDTSPILAKVERMQQLLQPYKQGVQNIEAPRTARDDDTTSFYGNV